MKTASTRDRKNAPLDDIRAVLEADEGLRLDARATKSARSKGRARAEKRDPYRTAHLFQKLRQRISISPYNGTQ